MSASDGGHLHLVRLLLQSGADVESRSKIGSSPLLIASYHGHMDTIRFLLQSGAAARSQNDMGHTPLMMASQNGHRDVVRLLLQNGAVVDSYDNDGWTPLTSASVNGHLDVVRLLLQNGAGVDFRHNNRHDKRIYYTPLHLASARGHLMVAELLIQHGAEVNALGPDGGTPLHLVTDPKTLETAQVLPTSDPDLKPSNRGESTPSSHRAAEGGHLKILELLLRSGADVNIRKTNDKTAIDLALDSGRLDVVRFIQEYGRVDSETRIDSMPLDAPSQDPLPNSAQPSPTLGKGTDVVDGRTSLHTASEEGDLERVRSLLRLDGGVDINGRNAFQETALLTAISEGKLEIAKLLIDYGADVNSHNKVGMTPLLAAIEEGHLEMVHLLLEHGADVNAKDHHHWTALHLASHYRHPEVVQKLLDRGANVHIQNDHGRTPVSSGSAERSAGDHEDIVGIQRARCSANDGILYRFCVST
ncbi:ankyrin repeat-containing domain protein [Russula earlei]|uniref:Ankyrin repeat-containing domain protein n=1 Tax=Russula earlei TaxID=71964 RepID=A0ACC0UJ49_9AGAM|nr:ankyrin repeat-containing domain protein [Russula earlei]